MLVVYFMARIRNILRDSYGWDLKAGDSEPDIDCIFKDSCAETDFEGDEVGLLFYFMPRGYTECDDVERWCRIIWREKVPESGAPDTRHGCGDGIQCLRSLIFMTEESFEGCNRSSNRYLP